MGTMTRMAMVVMAGGLLAGCETMGSLDRGLGTVADSVSTNDRVTGARVLGSGNRAAQIASANKEMDAAVADAAKKGAKFNAELDAAQYARLQRIASRILSVSHFAAEQGQWKVLLLPDTEWNAFVNGGSYIMVNKGLVDDKSMDDNAIAAVIGHEIAHNAANHISERSSYQLAAMVAGSTSAQRDSFGASFGTLQETEADQIGILYMALAGYDPRAASRVWERMFAQSGNHGAFIQTHPLNGDRARQTAAVADKVVGAGYYMSDRVNPDAASILQNNVLWQKRGATVAAGQGGGVAAVAETVLNAYMERENAKRVEKQQVARSATVATVSKQMQATGYQPVDADTIAVRFVYNGTTPLRSLIMAAVLPDKRRVVSAAGGTVPAGAAFILNFKASGIAGVAQNVAFSVDDAAY